MKRRTSLRCVLARELRRIVRRRLYVLLLLVLPLAGWGILASAFAQGVPTDLPIAVLDADRSATSRLLTRSLEASPSLHVALMTPDIAAAAAAIRSGRVYAAVSIPAGLEHGMLRSDAPAVTLLYNAQWLLPGSIILRDVRGTTDALSLQLDAGRHLQSGAAASQAMARAQPIRADVRALFNPSLDYAAFLFLALFPALFHMFVLLVAVDATGRELKHGTGRAWLRSAGGSTARALAGKLLPYAVWFTLLGSALLESSLHHAGVEPEGSRLLLHAAHALMVVACLAVGAALVALAGDLRSALAAAGVISAPSFAFAGVSFPLTAMPPIARAWALGLPVTHYQQVQAWLVAMNPPASVLAPRLAALLAFSAVGTCVAFLRLPALLHARSSRP